MAKKQDGGGIEETKGKPVSAVTANRPIAVVEGDKRSYDELMAIPKAQIVRRMSIPENVERYIIDVDNQTKLGKKIIALMDSLRNNDADTIRAVSEILGAVATMVTKDSTRQK